MFPSWAIWMLAVAQLGSPAEDVQTLRDRIEKHRSDGDYSAAVQDALKLKTLLSQTAGPDSEECRDCEFDLRYLQAVERLGEESLKFAQFQIMASETDDALAADAWEAADAGMATLLRIVKPTAEPGAAAKLLIWRARMNVMQENFRGAAELESLARAELGAMGIGKGKRAASLDSVTRDCLWDRGDYAQLKAFVPNSSDGSLDQTERFYQSHDALNLALACGDSEAIPSRLDEYRTASKALDIPNAAGFVLRGELLVALYWGRTDDVERIGRRLAALPEAEKVDTRFAAMHVAHQWEAAGRLADALDVWESVLDLAKRSYDGHDPEAESRKAVLELLGGADNDVWGKSMSHTFEVAEKRLPRNDARWLCVCNAVADACLLLERHDLALAVELEGLRRASVWRRPGEQRMVEARLTAALAAASAGERETANRLSEQALDDVQRSLGESSPTYVRALAARAYVLLAAERGKEAAQAVESAEQAMKRIFGDEAADHPLRVSLCNVRARLAAMDGRPEAAAAEFAEARRITSRRYGGQGAKIIAQALDEAGWTLSPLNPQSPAKKSAGAFSSVRFAVRQMEAAQIGIGPVAARLWRLESVRRILTNDGHADLCIKHHIEHSHSRLKRLEAIVNLLLKEPDPWSGE